MTQLRDDRPERRGHRGRGTRKVSDGVTIALDAMGGDRAPAMVLQGADIALRAASRRALPAVRRRRPDRARCWRNCRGSPARRPCTTPTRWCPTMRSRRVALRTGRRSSMRLAIEAVADGRADGVVSAGNTGALMAIAKFVLKTLPGIDRPAIASFFPTRRGESVMLDLGANVECDAENLVQFALMGDVFARTVLGLIAADRRPAQCRLGGPEGKRRGARRAAPGCAAACHADPLSRLCRGRRHRRGNGRCRSSPTGSPAMSPLKTVGGDGQAVRRIAARLVPPLAVGADRLSVCPRRAEETWRRGSIRAAITARCFSACAASRSRATARPTRSALPTRSASPST